MTGIAKLAANMKQAGSADRLPLLYGVAKGAVALDILRRLVEDTDAGCDTYEVRDLVEEARELLGVPRPEWRR